MLKALFAINTSWFGSDLKTIGAKMATKIPITPKAINNSDNVLENHMPWIKPAKVIIEFCTPVDVASMDKEQRKQIPDMVHEIILETYERNQQEIQ